MKDCIFCKIRDKEIAKEFAYEDEDIMAFPDIFPDKPVHLLVIPKQHITDFLQLEEAELLKKVQKVIQKLVKEHKLDTKGYRLLINGGGAQGIDHLHIHILGPMGKNAAI